MVKKVTKLTPEQKGFIVGRQYQARLDAIKIAKAVKAGKIVVKKK
jgi:hypothetical protein